MKKFQPLFQTELRTLKQNEEDPCRLARRASRARGQAARSKARRASRPGSDTRVEATRSEASRGWDFEKFSATVQYRTSDFENKSRGTSPARAAGLGHAPGGRALRREPRLGLGKIFSHGSMWHIEQVTLTTAVDPCAVHGRGGSSALGSRPRTGAHAELLWRCRLAQVVHHNNKSPLINAWEHAELPCGVRVTLAQVKDTCSLSQVTLRVRRKSR